MDGAHGAHRNLALEEAMMRQNRGIMVRVWTNDRSVIIGRGQLARYETDLKYCASNDIPVVRRLTAGGTVYHGPGNVNWSLFMGREVRVGPLRYTSDIREMFRTAAALVTDVSRRCGVKTWLDQPNRISSNEGKVSGMSGYVSRDGLLCHGTFLLSADLEQAKRLTEPAPVQLQSKYTRSMPMKMANTNIDLASFIASFREVLNERVGREVDVVQPEQSELDAMHELVEKYASDDWNFGDPFRV